MGRTSYIICGAQYKIKMWDPLFKIMVNFTMATSERASAKHRALRHTELCVTAQVSHPKRSLGSKGLYALKLYSLHFSFIHLFIRFNI